MFIARLRALVLFTAASASIISCETAPQTPSSPTAASSSTAVNADGSTLKVNAPSPISPTGGATGVGTNPALMAWQSTGRYALTNAFAHRFEVSDSSSFGNLLASGTGTNDGPLVRFTPTMPTNRQVFWRLRAEQDGMVGPWSAVMSFTTGTTSTPTPTPGGGPRTPDPAPGTRLPLPTYVQAVSQEFPDASDSCPLGVKYVNNPWQDRVVDRLRTFDTRWGYNGKPTRGPADNGGRPVVAAGDEVAYHYSAGADQNSP